MNAPPPEDDWSTTEPESKPAPDREAAKARVNGPALGLIAAGVISVINAIGGFVVSENMDSALYGGISEEWVGAINIGSLILSLVVGGLILFGGLKMRRLENYVLSLVAAILAMIPCACPGCMIILPLGVWAMIVLLDDNVRRSFA